MSYTESNPVAHNLSCPCGKTLSGDNVSPLALEWWEQTHAECAQNGSGNE